MKINQSHRIKFKFFSSSFIWKKNIFLAVTLMLILLSCNISAFDFDNVKIFEKGDLEYGEITIKNSFGLGDTIEVLTLTDNSDICENDCSAVIDIQLNEFGSLVDEIIFIDSNGVEQELDYKFYIIENGNKLEYNLHERLSISGVDAGTYTLLLEANKRPMETIDWVIKTKGKLLDEWALWGANITLNSPANDSKLNTGNVTFNCSAVSNSTLINVSLWTNTTGTWSFNENKNIGIFGNYSGINISKSDSSFIGVYVEEDNDTIYILDSDDKEVYLWWKNNRTYTGVSFDTSVAGNDNPAGIDCNDDLFCYITDFSDAEIYLWWKNNRTYTGVSFDTSVAGNDNPAGIYIDKGNNMMYISDPSDAEIYLWWKNNRTYTGVSFDTSVAGSLSPQGISGYNEKIFIVDFDDRRIYLFWKDNRTYTGDYISLFLSGDFFPYDLMQTKFFFYVAITNTFTRNSSILYYWNEADENNTKIFQKNISDGFYEWNCEACDIENCSFSTNNYTFTIDTSAPNINITYPTPFVDYAKQDQELDLNWSISNGAIDSCWYNYNNTNTSVNCFDNHTTFNITDQKNITFYVNDTASNLGSNFTTWDYKIFEVNQTYNNETIEGTFETFRLYLEKGSGVNVNSVVLHYNGQTKTSSLFSSGNNVIAESVLSIPSVLADTNKTFYFTITLGDSTIINTTNSSQLIKNIELDDCSSQPNLFLTLNLVDEENQSAINGNIEVYIAIINSDDYQEILTINNSYSSVNNKSFCSNIFLNDTSLLLGAEIRYDSENHSAEFYNIQRSELSDYPKNYTLYDLKDDDTTKFKLIYIGDDLVGVEGAIIQLQRKYISEGVYKIVEAPLTSSDSTSVVHVDTNTNSYKVTVVKDGEILGFFDNLVFICQSELTGECTLDLQDYLIPPNSIAVETIQDFAYTISSSLENRTITVDYSVPSGTTSEIKVVSTQEDIIGEETICNTTVSSAGGSIECVYEETIQDSYINYELYKDGFLVIQKSYIAKDDLRDDFGGGNYFILILFTISLVFMALLSPEWIVINSVISVIIGGVTWLIRGMDFVLGLGAIAWLFLGAVIIILKMAQKEDQ